MECLIEFFKGMGVIVCIFMILALADSWIRKM